MIRVDCVREELVSLDGKGAVLCLDGEGGEYDLHLNRRAIEQLIQRCQVVAEEMDRRQAEMEGQE